MLRRWSRLYSRWSQKLTLSLPFSFFSVYSVKEAELCPIVIRPISLSTMFARGCRSQIQVVQQVSANINKRYSSIAANRHQRHTINQPLLLNEPLHPFAHSASQRVQANIFICDRGAAGVDGELLVGSFVESCLRSPNNQRMKPNTENNKKRKQSQPMNSLTFGFPSLIGTAIG